MSRRGWEFSPRIRDRAIEEWHWNNPGRQDVTLAVHHRVKIEFAKKHGLPPAVIRSQQNAQAVPIEEHLEIHRNESEEEYWSIYQSLIGFINRLI